jgi:hypothetical protein
MWRVVAAAISTLVFGIGAAYIKTRERVSNLELRTMSTEAEVGATTKKIDETHDSVVRLETIVHKLEEDLKSGNTQQRQTNQKIIDKLTSIEVIVRGRGRIE